MRFDLPRARQILTRTPRVLRTLLADLDAAWTDNPYGPNTWSPREVVAHLIHAEHADWIPRARMMVQHGESRPFEPFDRNGHAPMLVDTMLAQLLDRFEAARIQSLRDLDALQLTAADLARTGTHPAFGQVTLAQLLATWAVHDLNHLAQISKGIAFQYQQAVGPWNAYLSILSPPAPR